MHSFSIFTSVLVMAATGVFAGKATIKNHCDHDVYLWSAGDTTSEMKTISAGGNHTEDYQTRAFGGVSLKLAKGTDLYSVLTPVAQIEYTNEASALWYDLSLVNGDPFESSNTVITPDADESTSCTAVTCPAGLTSCADAYMKSDDNWATHSCPAGTDLTVDLCAPSTENTKREVAAPRVHARDFTKA